MRFQHFGCDFHIDKHATGREAKLFECNKVGQTDSDRRTDIDYLPFSVALQGPDFSVHSERDGKLKREVAADIVSFMGFKGPFDGSREAARRFRMNLIYDSQTFDPEEAFRFLESRP